MPPTGRLSPSRTSCLVLVLSFSSILPLSVYVFFAVARLPSQPNFVSNFPSHSCGTGSSRPVLFNQWLNPSTGILDRLVNVRLSHPPPFLNKSKPDGIRADISDSDEKECVSDVCRLGFSGRLSGMAILRKIPRIIHQIWIGPRSPPVEIDGCRELFESLGWKHMLWGNDEVENWMEHKDLFERARGNGKGTYFKIADVLRLEILHRIGGVFVDADTICLRGIDDIVEETFVRGAEMFAACENEYARPGLIANGVIGMVPRSLSSFLTLNALYLSDFDAAKPWKSTGPLFLTYVIRKLAPFGLRCHVVRSGLFYPLHTTEIRQMQSHEVSRHMMRRSSRFESCMAQLWGSTFACRSEICGYDTN